MVMSPLVPSLHAAPQYPQMFFIRHESTAVGGNCEQNARGRTRSLLEGKDIPIIPRRHELLVLDLDDTLTATNAVDDECFVQALRIAFNIVLTNTNWTEYSH